MNSDQFSTLIDKTPFLIFDLDGTLVDSSASVRRAWRDFAARHQVPEADIFAISEGRQGHAVISELRPDLDAMAEDRLLIDFQTRDASDVVEVPGASDLLGDLDPQRWGIVTSCTKRLAMARLTAAQLPIPPLFITADDTLHSKPHPEGFQMAMRLADKDPSECVVFEDSKAGIEAAINAGIQVVQITHASHAYVDTQIPSVPDWSKYRKRNAA
ncbi:HAD-IA family hydrolase [Stieleria sp. JC731]|uniref:HAD-IA family hydrolase n=1 Tax=Pirellulaceae TaxID=2691357 RepID=UPI001E5B0819|nr:HAD-IA family hydrolase [Stieleria sp. JC731]MCC9603091.1 HAD-IA family hydrolase [Stieleria sp. JC731]